MSGGCGGWTVDPTLELGLTGRTKFSAACRSTEEVAKPLCRVYLPLESPPSSPSGSHPNPQLVSTITSGLEDCGSLFTGLPIYIPPPAAPNPFHKKQTKGFQNIDVGTTPLWLRPFNGTTLASASRSSLVP